MPAKVVPRPSHRQQLVTGTLVGELDPATVSRQLTELGDAMDGQVTAPPRFQGTITLVVGINVVNHGLGRTPKGATVTPTVADASFAWALTTADNGTATITVVGVKQPNAYVEVF